MSESRTTPNRRGAVHHEAHEAPRRMKRKPQPSVIPSEACPERSRMGRAISCNTSSPYNGAPSFRVSNDWKSPVFSSNDWKRARSEYGRAGNCAEVVRDDSLTPSSSSRPWFSPPASLEDTEQAEGEIRKIDCAIHCDDTFNLAIPSWCMPATLPGLLSFRA